jgi:hypothetical protein
MEQAYFVLYTLAKNEDPKIYTFAGWFEATYTYNDSNETLDITSWLKDNIERGRFVADSILIGMEDGKNPEWDTGEEDVEARKELWPDEATFEFFDNNTNPWITTGQFINGETPFSEYARGWKDGMEGNQRSNYDPEYMMGYDDAMGSQDLQFINEDLEG